MLGVEKQVQERLFEQVAIQVHGRQVRGEVALDVDVVLARAGCEEIDDFLDDFNQLGWLQVQVFSAREAKEVIRDLHQPLALML